jgi:hypothetical protein
VNGLRRVKLQILLASVGLEGAALDDPLVKPYLEQRDGFGVLLALSAVGDNYHHDKGRCMDALYTAEVRNELIQLVQGE